MRLILSNLRRLLLVVGPTLGPTLGLSLVLTLVLSLGLIMVMTPGLVAHASTADTSTPEDGPRVMVLGDSISAAYNMPTEAGWVALLDDRLASLANGEAINASISGDTTASGRTRLPAAIERHQPDIVIIALGGNDGLRGISLSELRDNLTSMIETIRASGAEPLLAGVRLPSNYGSAFVDRFLGIFAEVADSTNAAFVPMILAGVAEDPSLMQDDGIHPNTTAQPIILETIWSVLAPLVHSAPLTPAAEPPSS